MGPLSIVDDTPQTQAFTIHDLNPNSIQSIKVLKGAEATALYGARGAEGVIIITTKNAEKSGEDGNPMVVVNGEIKAYSTLSDITPASIEEVRVLKNRNAVRKYGESGKNGVIEITLKNP
jgi:TonB-dependent SusC/RagA subfamily outer membrane receptor